jgi:gluconate 2-dehydrogenase gamma chain
LKRSLRTKQKSIQRRKFLEMGLTATAAGVLASCSRTGGGPYWRFFTAAEAKTVDAICEQIIPADNYPGASQAGVVNFIDLQLTRHYKKHQSSYRKGVAGVDAASRKRFGKPFAELAFERQTELLAEVENNGSEFFDLIRTHTMQGFYGDPRHGGNRGAVSWKMLGLPDPPVRGRVPYEEKAG